MAGVIFNSEMVNNYKRTTCQAQWDEASMARAIKDVKEKRGSMKSIAAKYNIPRTTLRRHVETGSSTKKLGRFSTVFTEEQEEELVEYVFHMDQLFFGLTKEEFLRLVYQYAQANSIPHPFKKETAGHDFYKGFIARHPRLTLRRPEPTSIARARGFNRPQVYRFFDLFEAEIEKHKIDATRLFNMDETGIQTSSNKPPRVLSKLGKKQVGHIASTERGRTTTVICCCSAAGAFVPPLMIFARKRMAPCLLDGAPPGTQATVSDNGWTNGPIFLEWLRFFIDNVRPTEDKKVLLVMDNHESHKYLPALELASKNHVIFVSLAPHTTHRMQPLDFCVYGPLKTYFEQAVAVFQKKHVGRIINQKDVACLFGTAYLRAATTQNAVHGFEKTGLWPPNRYIFDDSDFLPATTMENPTGTFNQPQSGSQHQLQETENDHSRTASPSIIDQFMEEQSAMVPVPTNLLVTPPPISRSTTPALDYPIPYPVTANTPSKSPDSLNAQDPALPISSVPSTGKSSLCADAATSSPDAPDDQISATVTNDLVMDKPIDSTSKHLNSLSIDPISTCHKSPMALRPVPKMAPNKTSRQRKAQRAEILTSTPIKNEQREKIAKKRKADANREIRTMKNLNNKLSEKAGSSGTQSRAKSRRNANFVNKTSGTRNSIKKRKDDASSKVYRCFVCTELYEDPPSEDWIRCDDCESWAHEACTSYTGSGAYYCDICHEI